MQQPQQGIGIVQNRAAAATHDAHDSSYSEEITPGQRKRILQILETRASTDHRALEEFKRFDRNRDGLLQVDELHECLWHLNQEWGIPKPNTPRIQMRLNKFDIN